MVLIEYSSDEEYDLEEEEDIALILMLHNKTKRPKRGGSVFGREKFKRERLEADAKLMRNYFIPTHVYPEHMFRRRFRMSIRLFREIAERLKAHDRFFEQRRSACGTLGHNS